MENGDRVLVAGGTRWWNRSSSHSSRGAHSGTQAARFWPRQDSVEVITRRDYRSDTLQAAAEWTHAPCQSIAAKLHINNLLQTLAGEYHAVDVKGISLWVAAAPSICCAGKLGTERIVLAMRNEYGPLSDVLRAAGVHATRIRGIVAGLCSGLLLGFFIPMGAEDNRCTPVHAHDTAHAAMLATWLLRDRWA
ncbi:hypothetical protein BH23GEM9_BH23GEM9_22770 [soil metagenome]